MVIVPPGGFAGFAQMAPASRKALSPSGRSSSGRRRRKAAAGRKRKGSRSSRKRTGSKRKLKFGSPAWRKKYMKK